MLRSWHRSGYFFSIGLAPAGVKPYAEVAEQGLGDVALQFQVGIEIQRQQVSLVEIRELPVGEVDLVKLRSCAIVQFFADQHNAVENVERIGGVLAAVGQENGGFRHDRRGDHAFAPVVDLVVVESALAEPQKLDHVGAGEADGVPAVRLETLSDPERSS